MQISLSARIVATIWLLVMGATTAPLTADWAERSSSPIAMWAFGFSCMCCVLAAFGMLHLFAALVARLLRTPPDPPIPVARVRRR
jgi:purine-cytosine permease-like protein